MEVLPPSDARLGFNPPFDDSVGSGGQKFLDSLGLVEILAISGRPAKFAVLSQQSLAGHSIQTSEMLPCIFAVQKDLYSIVRSLLWLYLAYFVYH